MTRALSEENRARLLVLHGQGMTQEEIAQELNCHAKTVGRWLQRYNETGALQEKKRSGRRRCTSQEEDSRIVRVAEEWPTTSMRSLRTLCELPSSYQTCLRRAGEGGLRLRTMRQREAALQDPQKRAERLSWAEEAGRVGLDWTDSVVWVDESTFQSSTLHMRKARVQRRLPRADVPVEWVKRSGKVTVGVFGGLCAGRLLPLHIINGGFNGMQYRDVLRDLYWPALQEQFPMRTFRYLQDNAPAHKSRVVSEWCNSSAQELSAAFWQLPPYSPDLNPIEHVWARMKAGLRGQIFHSRPALIEAVRHQYQLVGADTRFLRTLCASMPRRINAVLAAEGGPTRY